MRGYFGIGIYNGKTAENIGTLWRTANLFGASFIFTVAGRYKKHATDTMNTPKHIPLYNYETFDLFKKNMPSDCLLVGIELHGSAVPIKEFKHPERCIYLLGGEDSGLSNEVITSCHKLVQLPGDYSMNVAVAGSIVMFDRINKL